MRAVLQRVKQAQVRVDGTCVGKIEQGIVMLLGIHESDTKEDMKYILDKTIFLRIFEDEAGKLNVSLQDISKSLLIVPNFTIYGDARKGRRPSYIEAANPAQAEQIFADFVMMAKTYDIPIETGIFQADMEVSIVNDGPVTILLDSKKQL